MMARRRSLAISHYVVRGSAAGGAEECVHEILLHLEKEGYIGPAERGAEA